jgi:hypothetical protein
VFLARLAIVVLLYVSFRTGGGALIVFLERARSFASSIVCVACGALETVIFRGADTFLAGGVTRVAGLALGVISVSAGGEANSIFDKSAVGAYCTL